MRSSYSCAIRWVSGLNQIVVAFRLFFIFWMFVAFQVLLRSSTTMTCATRSKYSLPMFLRVATCKWRCFYFFFLRKREWKIISFKKCIKEPTKELTTKRNRWPPMKLWSSPSIILLFPSFHIPEELLENHSPQNLTSQEKGPEQYRSLRALNELGRAFL